MQQCTPTCQHAVYTKSTRCRPAGHLVVITSRQCTMYTRGQNSYNTRLSTHMHSAVRIYHRKWFMGSLLKMTKK